MVQKLLLSQGFKWDFVDLPDISRNYHYLKVNCFFFLTVSLRGVHCDTAKTTPNISETVGSDLYLLRLCGLFQ
jgi:hypothetical protein